MDDQYARLTCGKCGQVTITQDEYHRQMLLADSTWECPICGENGCDFDDDFFECRNFP